MQINTGTKLLFMGVLISKNKRKQTDKTESGIPSEKSTGTTGKMTWKTTQRPGAKGFKYTGEV